MSADIQVFDALQGMVRGILNRVKRYVSVEASTDADGAITPKAVLWGDGRRYEIDEVVDARRAASLKVGGAGMRYTVRIGDHVTYLFHEDPRWFCEAKMRGEFAGREQRHRAIQS